jgi:exodeoxyribonuclease VII small subunit
MMSEQTAQNEAKLTFEQALKKLETCSEKIGDPDISLEDAILAYEEGSTYYERCNEILLAANQRIEEIGANND